MDPGVRLAVVLGGARDTRQSLADATLYGTGPFYSYLAPTNKGSLVAGTDFVESAKIDTVNFPANTTINWSWPNTPAASIYNFLQVGYGNYNGTVLTHPVVPNQTHNIATLTAKAALTLLSGVSDNYDVIYDMFLTSAEGQDKTGALFEVEVFLHTPSYAATYVAGATPVGTYTDGDGLAWTVAIDTTASPHDILVMPTNQSDQLNKLVDFAALFAWLKTQGTIAGTEWLNGFALGVEVRQGSGSIKVKSFNVAYTFDVSPAQTNYVPTQDLSSATWSKTNVTASGTDTILETVTSGQHNIFKSGITRAAGVKQFRAFADVAPVGGRFLKLQIYNNPFGANQAIAVYDLVAGVVSFSTAAGAFTGIKAYIVNNGDGSFRCILDFNTDGTSTGFTIDPQIQPDASTNSYAGDITKGLKIKNFWVFNMSAGSGGS